MNTAKAAAGDPRLRLYTQELSPEAWEGRFESLEELEARELAAIRRLAITGPLPKPPRVLDIGCGTGRAAPLFPEGLYVGLDRSEAFARYAAFHHTGAAAFLIGDMNHLPFAPQSFDVVLLIGTLESEREPLKRIRAHLPYVRPSGRLVFTLQNSRNLPGRLSSMFSRRYKQTFWSHQQITDILSELGVEGEMVTCYATPPGVLQAASRLVKRWRSLQRLLVSAYLRLERLTEKANLHLGYEWIVGLAVQEDPGQGGAAAWPP